MVIVYNAAANETQPHKGEEKRKKKTGLETLQTISPNIIDKKEEYKNILKVLSNKNVTQTKRLII